MLGVKSILYDLEQNGSSAALSMRLSTSLSPAKSFTVKSFAALPLKLLTVMPTFAVSPLRILSGAERPLSVRSWSRMSRTYISSI